MDPIATHSALVPLVQNLRSVIVGKDEAIHLALTALLARGHLLIEDVPGLGKTMLARALAQSLGVPFKRVQCTPDLLPADITGVSVYRQDQGQFDFVPGPVFSPVLLADEINRATPRTQSSLLEAMEERQVSVEGVSRPLPEPFFVMATQNPVELTGTFPLPEAQLDRFLLRLHMGYPGSDHEVAILEAQQAGHPLEQLEPVLDLSEIQRLQQEVQSVTIRRGILRYIVELSEASRNHSSVRLGISPRGSLALMQAARAYTYLSGDEFVTPDTVKLLAPAVLTHRLVLDPRKEYAGNSAAEIVQELLEQTTVPLEPESKVDDESLAPKA